MQPSMSDLDDDDDDGDQLAILSSSGIILWVGDASSSLSELGNEFVISFLPSTDADVKINVAGNESVVVKLFWFLLIMAGCLLP